MSGGSANLQIAVDHPAFAGHFPGRPIVPGVVLLDEALRAIAAAEGFSACAWKLGSAKFVRPVGPGEPLLLRWQPPGAGGAIAFTIETAGEPVASGSLTPQSGEAVAR
jgi:3-hydroxymyristoyl/3-hydroxydecanoyl-(acyl carrier protein) dehydratase